MPTAQRSVKGHKDFRRLWAGRAASQFGSDIGAVALPVVAVTVVDATDAQIVLLAAVTAVTTVLLAFPIGGFVEFGRKRPAMVTADLVRFVALAAIPLAATLNMLTFWQLCAVAVVNTGCQLMFSAASQAHLRDLVSAERIVDANGRLESTVWLSLTTGRSLGGLIIAGITAVGALWINAVTFVLSAVAVWRIRAPEPDAPRRREDSMWWAELPAGLGFAWRHRTLRPILISWVCFAGASGMAFPISTVFYLRDLGFSAWQYGLLMGLPSLGGFLGARIARVAAGRLGTVGALWWASVCRTPWLFLIACAVPGTWGLVTCGLAFAAQLCCAALANSTMTAYRQLVTPHRLQARVASLWSFATTASQPLFILLGGVAMEMTGTRGALVLAASLMTVSALLLPRTERGRTPESVDPSTADSANPLPDTAR